MRFHSQNRVRSMPKSSQMVHDSIPPDRYHVPFLT